MNDEQQAMMQTLVIHWRKFREVQEEIAKAEDELKVLIKRDGIEAPESTLVNDEIDRLYIDEDVSYRSVESLLDAISQEGEKI